jgi:hypothetical protein
MFDIFGRALACPDLAITRPTARRQIPPGRNRIAGKRTIALFPLVRHGATFPRSRHAYAWALGGAPVKAGRRPPRRGRLEGSSPSAILGGCRKGQCADTCAARRRGDRRIQFLDCRELARRATSKNRFARSPMIERECGSQSCGRSRAVSTRHEVARHNAASPTRRRAQFPLAGQQVKAPLTPRR